MELNTTRSPRRARCSHSQAREEAAAKAAEHRLARVTSSIELDRHSVQVSLVNGLLIASDGSSECTSDDPLSVNDPLSVKCDRISFTFTVAAERGGGGAHEGGGAA
jgi:hypothetical protein